jgi:hypothetical protein
MKFLKLGRKGLVGLAIGICVIAIGGGVVIAQTSGGQDNGAPTGDEVHGSGVGAATVTSGNKPVFIALPAPVRFLDTRNGTGGTTGPIGNGGTFDLQITGVSGVPADATSVVLNVTSTQATSTGNIQVYPTGAAVPSTSTLNLQPGADVPNAATVGIGTAGKIRFRATVNSGGTVQLIADVTGYYVNHQHSDQYLSAVVAANGTLVRGTGATAASNTFTGNYVVTFDRDVSACVFVADPGVTGSTGATIGTATVAGANGQPTGVFVRTLDTTFTNVNNSFHLMVMC